MYLDLAGAVCAESSRGVAVEQFREQVSSRWGHDLGSWEVQGFREDFAVHFVRVFVVEGREARQHFVQQYAQRPPIHRLRITLPVQELGGEILGGAAEGVGFVLVFHVEFAEAEVAEGDVADVVDEDVLGFQVAVDDAEAVEAFQRAQQFGGVEAGAVDVEALFLLEMVE